MAFQEPIPQILDLLILFDLHEMWLYSTDLTLSSLSSNSILAMFPIVDPCFHSMAFHAALEA